MSASEDRDFNRFKGSLYIIAGLGLIGYALYYFIGVPMFICACPNKLPGYNPVQSALPIIYSIFVIFVALVGVVLVVLGYYTARHGGFTWKHLNSKQKIQPGEL